MLVGFRSSLPARRKVCDVAVLESSPAGLTAAQHLAQAGRRVLVLDIAYMPKVRVEALSPVHLPHLQPLAVHFAEEGLKLWESVGSYFGTGLLHPRRGTVEVEFPLSAWSGPGAADEQEAVLKAAEGQQLRLDRLAEACLEAGVRRDLLSHSKVANRWPQLRVPPGSRVLEQRDGGMLLAEKAVGALASLAGRSAGAEILSAAVLGWRDAGGHFQLRCGGGDGEPSIVVEAEQLLIAPHPSHAPRVLEAFGLSGGVKLGASDFGMWPATSDMEGFPLARVAAAQLPEQSLGRYGQKESPPPFAPFPRMAVLRISSRLSTALRSRLPALPEVLRGICKHPTSWSRSPLGLHAHLISPAGTAMPCFLSFSVASDAVGVLLPDWGPAP